MAGGGRAFKFHSWEIREGGYRKTALFLGNGLWPLENEERLIRFLLDRNFRVLAPEIAYGSGPAPRLGLQAFRKALVSFAKAEIASGLPLYLIACSASAGAVLPIASTLPELAAVALIAPIVDFPPPGSRRPFFILPGGELAMTPEALSGEPELLEGLVSPKTVLRFRGRDQRELNAGLGRLCAPKDPVKAPALAFFAGDEDPCLSPEGRSLLARAGAKQYGYPRVRHEPGRDRFADNYYADLGSFLDEVEARAKKRGKA
jgi:hypothetical protein